MLLEKFAELHRARIEHYLNLLKIYIEDAERLGEMRWENARMSLEKNTEIARAMSETQDMTALFRLSKELTNFNLEEAWRYPLGIYKKALETQAELSRLIEESLTAYGIVITQGMDADSEAGFANGQLMVDASVDGLVRLDNAVNQVIAIAR